MAWRIPHRRLEYWLVLLSGLVARRREQLPVSVAQRRAMFSDPRDAGPAAVERFLEFFAAAIANDLARRRLRTAGQDVLACADIEGTATPRVRGIK